MKGALAAMMCAVKDVAEQRARPRPLRLRPRRGVRGRLAAARPTCSSPAGYRGDFAITGEPTDLHIGIQAKGVLAVRVAVSGVAAHGSTPWLGDNAILKAHDVFRRIETLPFSRESSDLFDRPSINLARIEGGDAFNKVPDRCTMDVDIRYLPDQDPGEILAQIRAIPDLEVAQVLHARARAWCRAATRTCARCARASAARSRARRCRSAATAPRTRSRSWRRASPPSSSAPSAPATTAPRSGCRSPRCARFRQALTDFVALLPAWLEREGTDGPDLHAVEGGLA